MARTLTTAPVRRALAALVAGWVAIPLAVLAASGHKLPDVPRWDYVAFIGDGNGFYAAAREFMAAWGRLPRPLLAGLAVAALAVVELLVYARRRRGVALHWIVAAGALAFALLCSAGVWKMRPPGAAVFGWPLLWSIPMLPLRALGVLGDDSAFAVGLPLQLAANAVTLVALCYLGQ